MYCPMEPLSKDRIWEVWYKNQYMDDFKLDDYYWRYADASHECEYLKKLGNISYIVEKPAVAQLLLDF